jgi:tRNA-2-methylthio-N6-dimethylallyladenosine synthase
MQLPTKSTSYNKKSPKPRSVYITTYGCQMNDRDSEAVLGLLLERGYSVCMRVEDADVVLVNTCSVREHAENRAISFLGALKKLKNSKFEIRNCPLVVGLIGCMAKNRGEEVFNKMPHIDLICSPSVLEKIPQYIQEIQNTKYEIRKGRKRIIDLGDGWRNEEFYRAPFRAEFEHAQVVISVGCSNYCSYCVVPFVRGELRPRNPQDIVDEVKRNVGLGIKKITLLGQNVNDYKFRPQTTPQPHQRWFQSKGQRLKTDKEIDFVELLRMIEGIEEVEEIDFITSHPKNTSKELFCLMAESKKIKKHLHLPYQSGSDRILKLMNRGYTKDEYLRLINDYKQIAGGTLSTDVIVGFPTETEDDFYHTRDVLERVRFRYAYIFKYSPRPNTEAAKLEDSVPQEVKARRHKELLELQKEISLNKL